MALKQKIATIILVTLIIQMLILVMEFRTYAVDEETAVEVTREYEIPKRGEFDISENGDGSLKAIWTRENRTLTIAGTGNIKYSTISSNKELNKYIKKIIKVVIQEGVTSLGDSAFDGCSNLQDITIPEGVTSIGDSAFTRCSNLQDITIPEGVTSIGYGAFDGCSNLQNIKVSENNTEYKSINGVLYSKDSKNIICYPAGKTENNYSIINGVTSIGDCAFDGCSNLQDITIPEGVTSIGSFAFYECSNLQDITIPEGVTSIGRYAFNGCTTVYVKQNSSGHQSLESAKINYIIIDKTENMDNVPPTATVSYSTTEKTNGNVVVTITANEELQGVTGWTLSSNKKVLTKEYSQNATEIITIKDLSGNTQTVNVAIANIDKTTNDKNEENKDEIIQNPTIPDEEIENNINQDITYPESSLQVKNNNVSNLKEIEDTTVIPVTGDKKNSFMGSGLPYTGRNTIIIIGILVTSVGLMTISLIKYKKYKNI